jgi:predicted Zn-dependent protease
MNMVGKIALVVTLALGCAENPATGKRQLSLVPQSQEISIGKEAAAEVAQSVGLYEQPALQKYVSDIGQSLQARAERPNLPWTFQVVDDAAVNAFALPGGYIFVTRGILAHMNNEAQLASVLGHEIAHVTAKHSVSQISKQQLAQLGLGVGMLLSEDVRRFGQLGVVGLNVLFLKFSRDNENQADELGFRYASRTGYDVREMPHVFETLKRASGGGGGRLPEWLATHPDPDRRIEKTQARIAQAGAAGGKVAGEEYLRAIDGITFGVDPRQGFFQGDRYLHPELQFTVTMPGGWQRANLRQAVIAVSPDQDGVVQITGTNFTDPNQALQQFNAQQGVRPMGAPGRVSSSLPSVAQQFAATTDQGEIAGVAAFVAHRGHVYQVLEFAVPAKLSAYAAAFTQVPASFAPLTDPAALAVKPARLQVLSVPAPQTLAQLYQSHPTTTSLETIALVNQMQPGTQLAAGQKVKWVTGGMKEQTAVSLASPPTRR